MLLYWLTTTTTNGDPSLACQHAFIWMPSSNPPADYVLASVGPKVDDLTRPGSSARNRWLLVRPRREFSHSPRSLRLWFVWSSYLPDVRWLMSFPDQYASGLHRAPPGGCGDRVVVMHDVEPLPHSCFNTQQLKQIRERDLCGLISYCEGGGAIWACF